jgi:hypothetical protein
METEVCSQKNRRIKLKLKFYWLTPFNEKKMLDEETLLEKSVS